jgi:ribonuclease D
MCVVLFTLILVSGMISLIQIATSDQIYVVDPFPLYSEIKKELKEILEDSSRIIVVHGGDNDFLWMKRDFGFHIIGAVDMQYIHQSRLGGGPRISFDDLVSYYLPKDLETKLGRKTEKKIAQASDWTNRPLHSSLLEYAANDVRFLMIVWNEIKKLVSFSDKYCMQHTCMLQRHIFIKMKLLFLGWISTGYVGRREINKKAPNCRD